MEIVCVIYEGNREARFDREYYDTVHLPLVMEAWGTCGLEEVAAFYPAGNGAAGVVAMAICKFRDANAFASALATARTAQVIADVKNFTDLKPSRWRLVST